MQKYCVPFWSRKYERSTPFKILAGKFQGAYMKVVPLD